MAFKLHITGPYETKSVTVENELSVGRTDQANVVLDDNGLSRLNTTFFVDEGRLLVVDENSTNGTFVNGERISGPPQILKNGDRLKIGTYTEIAVEIGEGVQPVTAGDGGLPAPSVVSAPQTPAISQLSGDAGATSGKAKTADRGSKAAASQKPLIAASATMTILILLFGGVGIYFLAQNGGKPTKNIDRPIVIASAIPVRVIDPLGGEDEDDLDDLIASWETAEKEIDASSVSDVTVGAADTDESDLNVTAAQLADAQRKALEPRPGEAGIRPAGLAVPKELYGDGVIKQKAKLREMKEEGYQQPMDFADLAAKRLSGELIEMPMATNTFYLDVGGSAQDSPFMSFAFPDNRSEIMNGNPKFSSLARLAENFAGKKYDLNNSADRKQMRVRLLRMFNPKAKPILKELAEAYFQKFGRPLRVTSLTRSMDYQILLNSGNANSFKVRGEGSLPPHTSGCAFDLARKHMPVEEQNFVMAKLAEMERAGRLDALIEYGVNACFHIFIYRDGNPPRM